MSTKLLIRTVPVEKPRTLLELMNACGASDGMERLRARLELIRSGRRALPVLLRGLAHPNRNIRWDSAKALTEIHDAGAAEALVAALTDEEMEVRWLAAEGLGELGPAALEPLLRTLAEEKESAWIREGVRHVLTEFKNQQPLGPIMWKLREALKNDEPASALAYAAVQALQGDSSGRKFHQGFRKRPGPY